MLCLCLTCDSSNRVRVAVEGVSRPLLSLGGNDA